MDFKNLFFDKINMLVAVILLIVFGFILEGCNLSPWQEDVPKEDGEKGEEKKYEEPLEVEIKGAFTDDDIAFQLKWQSHKNYPGQFQDLIYFTGDDWERVEEEDRFNEDKVSVMIEDPEYEIEGFEEGGCYVTCHSDMGEGQDEKEDVPAHYALAEKEEEIDKFGLDKWVWKGARSGPMDFAVDKWISRGKHGTGQQGRKEDFFGEESTNWLNEEGDGIIEKQPEFEAKWQDVSLPRFVFNPDKVPFDNYFYADLEGDLFFDPQNLGEKADSMDYEPLKVAYHDYDFQPEDDRVNTIDIKFLKSMAEEEVDPDIGEEWEEFWSNQLGITTPQGAEELLDDIVQNLEEGALLSLNVGFIFESSQHDVTSIREFDPNTNTWTLTLMRALLEEDEDEKKIPEEPQDDVDLEDLLEDEEYNVAFAIHDIDEGGIKHYVSMPYSIGNEETEADIELAEVEEDLTIDTTDEIERVDWDEVEPTEAVFYLPGEVYFQDLIDEEFHGEGADFVDDEARCLDCHSEEELAEVSREYIE